jgi:hypothetical protein
MLRKITTYLSLALLLLTSAVPMPGITPIPQAEALSAAMWTHGTSVQVENPGVVNIIRFEDYTSVGGNPGGATWLHFAIPTPVILSDVRQQIDSLVLVFETISGATVTNVHIYDGERRIKEHNNLNLSGNWEYAVLDVPEKPVVSWGVGISVRVSFAPGGGISNLRGQG